MLAAVLLLLALAVALSPFLSGADEEGYAEIERVVSIQVDHDGDVGDVPESVCLPQAWSSAPLQSVLPHAQDTLLPHIGGLFTPEPYPPKLA